MIFSEYILLLLKEGTDVNSFIYQAFSVAVVLLFGVIVYLIMHYGVSMFIRHFYEQLYKNGKSAKCAKEHTLFIEIEKKNTNRNERVKCVSIMEMLCRLVSVVSMHIMFPLLLPNQGYVADLSRKTVLVIIIFLGYIILRKICNAVHYKITEKDEIRGANMNSFFQMVKLSTTCFSFILSLSVIMDMNVYLVITGLGAFAAVLMLIFKDSILGLVAGIQLIQNDMVKKGDWISMPKYNVDGVVESINLTTVKVRNFDDTIITVPPYLMVSDSFQNWKGMREEGKRGRRVKRMIPIDMDTIRFIKDEDLKDFKDLPVSKEWIDKQFSDERTKVRTNVTLFRAYLNEHISEINSCNKNEHAYHFVRILNADGHGLPLEIYYYSNLIEKEQWPIYEDEQSKIVEFCLASLPLFHLKAYQCKYTND